MATAPSLFGATPESIQQARDAALNQEANAYAKLDPFQRATAGLYRGGNQLGGAIGRMLGGQDPEMQRMQKRQELISGVNPNDLASIAAGIQKAMAANDYPAAQELAAGYKALEESQAKTGLEKQQTITSAADATAKGLKAAESNQALQSQSDRVATLTAQGIPAAQAQGIASNPAAFAQVLKDKNVATTVDYAAAAARLGYPVHPGMGGYSQEQMTAMTDYIDKRKVDVGSDIARAGKATTVIPLGDIFDKFSAQSNAKFRQDTWKTAGEAYAAQVPMLGKLDTVLKALPTTTTGSFGNTILAASKFASALGINVDEKRMTDGEYLNAISSQVLQTIARNFPGSQSNKDLEALKLSKFSLTQQLPTIIKIITDLRMEMGSNVKAYEKLSRLPDQERYNTDPNIVRADMYRKMATRKEVDAKLKSGNYTRADVDQLRALDEELK
jgi:hypothetical protein